MLNPEFERNLWLEFSRHRLIATPVLIGIIFMLMHSMGMRDLSLSFMAMIMFLGLSLLWGGHKAAEAVLEEINDNTWDFQRLSSLSPWSLTLGKLFGGTSFIWYGSLMLLFLYVCLSSADDITPSHTVITNTALLLLSALICHSAALLSSLQAARYAGSVRTKQRIINHHILGALAGIYVASAVTRDYARYDDTIAWYSGVYNTRDFMTVLAVCIFLWLLLGCYWQMRAQLKVRTGPGPWACFVLFVMVLMTGFHWGYSTTHGLMVAFLSGMVLFYLMLIQEAWNGTIYRQIQSAWRKKQRAIVLQLFPRWLLTLMIVVPTGLLYVILHTSGDMFTMAISSVLAIALFGLRDAAIFHYFRLSPTSRRAFSTSMLYLVVLYGLVPWTLSMLGLGTLARLFYPFSDFSGDTLAMTACALSGAIQAGACWAMVRGQWRRHWQ